MVSGHVMAGERILDCNTSLGPDQQATVIQSSEGLLLEELTTSGSFVRRPLTSVEWQSKKIRLRDDGFGSVTYLYKTNDGWYVDSKGSGVSEFGVADCFVEK